MKKILIVFFLLFSLNSQSQTWSLKWHNSGNHWIGGWHINIRESYVKFSQAGLNDKMFFASLETGWGSIMEFNPSAQDGWVPFWSNNGSHDLCLVPINLINTCYLYDMNGIRIGNFGENFPQSDWFGLYNGNSTDMLNFSQRNILNLCSFQREWHPFIGSATFVNGGFSANFYKTETFPDGFPLKSDNRCVPGDFDVTNPLNQEEILSVNTKTGSAVLHFSAGNQYYYIWDNHIDGWISNWHIDTQDRYLNADIDGDNKDELLAISGEGWFMAQKYNNGGYWDGIYGNSGTGWINGWHIDINADDYNAADFDGDGKDELVLANKSSGWFSIKKYQNGNWPDLYTNNGNGWINSWHMSDGDSYRFFKRYGKINMLCVNDNGWSMVQEFNMPGPPVKDNFESSISDKNSNLTISNYPNPFNPTTKINFYLPMSGDVTLDIYNSLGSKVKTLVNQSLNSGDHTFEFDGADFSSGMYFYKLSTPVGVITKKMLLVK
jgi:hypothetical protein